MFRHIAESLPEYIVTAPRERPYDPGFPFPNDPHFAPTPGQDPRVPYPPPPPKSRPAPKPKPPPAAKPPKPKPPPAAKPPETDDLPEYTELAGLGVQPSGIIPNLSADEVFAEQGETAQTLLDKLLEQDFTPKGAEGVTSEFDKLLQTEFERLLNQDFTPKGGTKFTLDELPKETSGGTVTGAITLAALATQLTATLITDMFDFEAKPQRGEPGFYPPVDVGLPELTDVGVPAADLAPFPGIEADLVPQLEELQVEARRLSPTVVPLTLITGDPALPRGSTPPPRPITQPNPFVSPLPSPAPTGIPILKPSPRRTPAPLTSPEPVGVGSPQPQPRTGKKPAPETRKETQPQTEPQREECPSKKSKAYKQKYGCEQGYYRETETGIVYKKWSTRKCPSSRISSPSRRPGRPITS